jgi:hypothetical protein
MFYKEMRKLRASELLVAQGNSRYERQEKMDAHVTKLLVKFRCHSKLPMCSDNKIVTPLVKRNFDLTGKYPQTHKRNNTKTDIQRTY